MNVNDIRVQLGKLLRDGKRVGVAREASMTELMGAGTIELVGVSFIADEPAIFGTVNQDYVEREEKWYYSTSRNVADIPGKTPQIWEAVADSNGLINSNYGWCIFSSENGFVPDVTISLDPDESYARHALKETWLNETPRQTVDERSTSSQYSKVIEELKKNPESRRAVMIYTRPSMWVEYNLGGRSDFCCTNTVQYLVRDGAVHAVVQMRSNDVFSGYRNDQAWQRHVLTKVAGELSLSVGDITWQVGSLHVYARDFYLVDHFNRTGEIAITKKAYAEKYPESPFVGK